MKKVVVLTGGIGSGKTTVENIFSEIGVETVDADKVSSNLIRKNTEVYKKILRVFGQSILSENEEIDRLKMRNIIFRSSEAKERLEGILHPKIQSIMTERVEKSKGPYVLQVIPLWYEIHGEERPKGIWKVVTVETPIETRRSRAILRSKADMKTFDIIIKNQSNDAERRKIADDIIVNTGNIQDLILQVKTIHEVYLNYLSKA